MNEQQSMSELLDLDQSLLKQYKKKEITLAKYREESRKISENFLKILKKKPFPSYLDEPKQYKAAITLALHLSPQELSSLLHDILKDFENSIKKDDLAYFIDRVRVFNDEPQLYGTQFFKSQEGEIKFYTIEDQGRLDERRAQMNLSSFEEYFSFVSKNY